MERWEGVKGSTEHTRRGGGGSGWWRGRYEHTAAVVSDHCSGWSPPVLMAGCLESSGCCF